MKNVQMHKDIKLQKFGLTIPKDAVDYKDFSRK